MIAVDTSAPMAIALGGAELSRLLLLRNR